MLLFIAPALSYLRDRALEYLDFLRSVVNTLAPKPQPLASPYTPPFLGGQSDEEWIVLLSFDHSQQLIYDETYQTNPDGTLGSNNGRLVNGIIRSITAEQSGVRIITSRQNSFRAYGSNQFTPIITSIKIFRGNGSPNVGANMPNPNPSPSIADDGLFDPQNPKIADDNGIQNASAIVLAPALPLVLVTTVIAAYNAAVAAARAAASALEAIQKIAEALENLSDLWKKLKEFLDEWEKGRPKKRDVIRQTYGQLLGDGAIDFFPSNNQKYEAIQLDVVITSIPIGTGKKFGSLSPHRYIYPNLGHIAFYSVNQGILSVHPIEFKRNSYEIPKLAVGFIYHLGLDEQTRGFAFASFSVEKT